MIAPDTVSNTVIGLVDTMATFAAIIGGELPMDAGEDSDNILPVLLGGESHGPIRHPIIHQARNGTPAIRDGEWKYISGRPPKLFPPRLSASFLPRIAQIEFEHSVGFTSFSTETHGLQRKTVSPIGFQ